MDGCVYRSQFDMCEKHKEKDKKKGIRRWCDFENCEYKHPSNSDRIRTMTDEELAVLLEGCICPKDPCPDIDRDTPMGKKRCTKCWLDWLKEGAEQ